MATYKEISGGSIEKEMKTFLRQRIHTRENIDKQVINVLEKIKTIFDDNQLDSWYRLFQITQVIRCSEETGILEASEFYLRLSGDK